MKCEGLSCGRRTYPAPMQFSVEGVVVLNVPGYRCDPCYRLYYSNLDALKEVSRVFYRDVNKRPIRPLVDYIASLRGTTADYEEFMGSALPLLQEVSL